jgi:uncharacterized protein (DUF1800 family)
MRASKTWFFVLTVLGATLSLDSVSAATVDVVEYYNPATRHWFRTPHPGEIAAYDAKPAWVRTGLNFKVWPTAPDALPNALPACQYSAPVYGADVRFYGVNPDECNFLRSYPEAVYEGTPFYALMPQSGACTEGTQPVYRNFFSAGDVRFRFSTSIAAYQDTSDVPNFQAQGAVFCVPGLSDAKRADVVRLLKQSTFGPNDDLIARAMQQGSQAFVDEQLARPASRYPQFSYYPIPAPDSCKFNAAAPAGAASLCARDNYSLFQVQLGFLKNALTGEDQLRQRVAFALSQIFVVSGVKVNMAYGMAAYQQLLLDGAFGNFRDLLYKVTLNPVMGHYLDMVNNDKPDAAKGTEPNENYAREILQLFSIGVVELNLDGTPKRDAQGNELPAYRQETIEGLAHAFTGWTYAPLPGAPARLHNPVNYGGEMVAVESNHDRQPKAMLSGDVLPDGRSASQDLNAAIDNIFNHPNVGPFIGRQLIQKLVTGSPSAAYVARIASVFNSNGAGARGDLGAVVRAILLDPEARGEIKTAGDFGHLKEPVLYVTGMLRALNGKSDGVYLRNQLSAMGQNLFYPASVFNYYPPDHTLPGNGPTAPEFAIQNAATTFSRVNFANALIYGNGIAPDPTVTGSVGTAVDLSGLRSLAYSPALLVDRLNALMANGALSSSALKIIQDAVAAVPAADSAERARLASYLVATASQSQVDR